MWIRESIITIIKGFKPKSAEAAGQPILTFKFSTLLPGEMGAEMSWIQQTRHPVLNESIHKHKQIFGNGVLVSRLCPVCEIVNYHQFQTDTPESTTGEIPCVLGWSAASVLQP